MLHSRHLHFGTGCQCEYKTVFYCIIINIFSLTRVKFQYIVLNISRTTKRSYIVCYYCIYLASVQSKLSSIYVGPRKRTILHVSILYLTSVFSRQVVLNLFRTKLVLCIRQAFGHDTWCVVLDLSRTTKLKLYCMLAFRI